MISAVVDASVVVHVLSGEGGASLFRAVVSGEAVAPHLLDLEVVRALRRAHIEGRLTEPEVLEALGDFASYRIERYSHELFVQRIWALRHNVTTYDASYVALAEMLHVPLLTRDRRLANSSGHTARIEYID
jgi:predicted nucleic acid-binding protein